MSTFDGEIKSVNIGVIREVVLLSNIEDVIGILFVMDDIFEFMVK